MINTKLNKFIIILCSLAFFSSCAKLQGEFVLKRPFDETYKKLKGNRLEFKTTDKIEWAFIPKNNKNRFKLAITIMKKEIVWVDIRTRLDYVDMFKKSIYGSIEKLTVGKYYILITDVKNKVTVSKLYFTIYKESN